MTALSLIQIIVFLWKLVAIFLWKWIVFLWKLFVIFLWKWLSIGWNYTVWIMRQTALVIAESAPPLVVTARVTSPASSPHTIACQVAHCTRKMSCAWMLNWPQSPWYAQGEEGKGTSAPVPCMHVFVCASERFCIPCLKSCLASCWFVSMNRRKKFRWIVLLIDNSSVLS